MKIEISIINTSLSIFLFVLSNRQSGKFFYIFLVKYGDIVYLILFVFIVFEFYNLKFIILLSLHKKSNVNIFSRQD